jgi:predicted esterase
MCYFEPPPVDAGAGEGSASSEPPDTLIVFLHSLVRADSDWQYEQQRLMMRTASAMNVALLMPRGLPGIGPGRDPRTVAWPGSPRTQEQYEEAVIAEWDRARTSVEAKRGQRFSRLLIFGFSNGAYYATTLAVRNRYAADGYGLFAGGTGSKYNRLLASRSGAKVPVFVGYGTKDPAHADMQSLARMLGDLGWPHQVKAANIGHWVSDAQLQAAIRFLIHSAPVSE